MFVNSTRGTRENQNGAEFVSICLDRHEDRSTTTYRSFRWKLQLLARIRAKDYLQYYRQGQTADPKSVESQSFQLAKLGAFSEKCRANFFGFSCFSFPLFRHFIIRRVGKRRLIKLRRESSVRACTKGSFSCSGLGKSSQIRFKKKKKESERGRYIVHESRTFAEARPSRSIVELR